MPTKTSGSSPTLEMEEDPRWQLVERIIASPAFARTERLSSFLQCVCQLAQSGQVKNINEQYIGTMVFGRSPDYDSGIDSIVRSHASRLRHRLQQYFEEDGAHEEMVLTIPKGGYIPVFEMRQPPAPIPSTEKIAPALKRVEGATDSKTFPQIAGRASVLPEPVNTGPTPRITLVGTLIAALVLSTGLAASSISYLMLHRAKQGQGATGESTRLFWGNLFSPDHKTIVVNADSGLVILQGLTKKRVTLDNYLSGEYLDHPASSPLPEANTLNLARRRYTSVVDLSIDNKLFRTPGIDLQGTEFRFARDLRMDDIKEGNLVLLGTYESTPWVQLFEPSMNFYFQNDIPTGVFSIINRSPQPGEQPRYDSIINDPQHTVFGLVAYRPTLSGSGKVLILEGQSMAGTETRLRLCLRRWLLRAFPQIHSQAGRFSPIL